jgi:SOS-response transcriptional repressor LexA
MKSKLTKKQTLILEFITDFTKMYDYSPSYREIMTGVGLSSVSAVAEHIDNLVAKGAIKKIPGAARSLEIIDTSYPETTKLFNDKITSATPEEESILRKAAEILNINLD